MADPAHTFVIQERITGALWLSFLIVSVAAISYLAVRPYNSHGAPIEAQVVRVGSYAAPGSMGGDLPILIVRLPNGSIGQVTSSWEVVDDCMPGRWITLLQRGSALRIGPPGCRKKP
jgi:hypothetical protein